jgi:hypothetical protein
LTPFAVYYSIRYVYYLPGEPPRRRKTVDQEWRKAMTINLPRGGILIIDLHQQELSVENKEGKLWITWTGGGPDYVLNQGGKCVLSGPGEVFIEALGHACLAVFCKSGLAMKVNARSLSPERGSRSEGIAVGELKGILAVAWAASTEVLRAKHP